MKDFPNAQQIDFESIKAEAKAGEQVIAYMLVAISGGIVGFGFGLVASVFL